MPPAASAMRICELPSTEVVPPPASRSAWLTVTVGMPEGAESRPPGPSSSSATVWLTLSWAMPLAITAISVAPGLRVDGPGMSAQPVQFAGVVQAPLAAFHWQVAAPASVASTHISKPRMRRGMAKAGWACGMAGARDGPDHPNATRRPGRTHAPTNEVNSSRDVIPAHAATL